MDVTRQSMNGTTLEISQQHSNTRTSRPKVPCTKIALLRAATTTDVSGDASDRPHLQLRELVSEKAFNQGVCVRVCRHWKRSSLILELLCVIVPLGFALLQELSQRVALQLLVAFDGSPVNT